MSLVDVCIVTFQRPAALGRLLESLVTLRSDCLSRLIVVDNDAAASARAVVDAYRPSFKMGIEYHIEPQQGVTFARNRVLDLVRSQYFAFVDDDEVVSENWLTELLKTAHQYQADVVLGPVQRRLPNEAPTWAHAHPCFKPKARDTGTIVQTGGAGNALIRTSLVTTPPGMRFNDEYARTGGEDTAFFYSLSRAGAKIVWCAEAEISEEVPMARTTAAWVCKRSFRSGQAYAHIYHRFKDPWGKSWIFCIKVIQLFAGAVALAPTALLSKIRFMILLARVCSAAGQISALLFPSFRYEEYRASRITSS